MRIILAGTGSSVGKTTIATGIMKALSDKFNVQPFKEARKILQLLRAL